MILQCLIKIYVILLVYTIFITSLDVSFIDSRSGSLNIYMTSKKTMSSYAHNKAVRVCMSR